MLPYPCGGLKGHLPAMQMPCEWPEMFLHRVSWDVARRRGAGCGGTLGGPIPRKVGMWGAGKHTTFSCREGRARRIQGSIPPSPKLLLLLPLPLPLLLLLLLFCFCFLFFFFFFLPQAS